jgi:DNA end-binding protein Ku
MAPRAISSGTLSFGLVNIPVKVYSANESASRISFHQLHDKCKGRIKQQLYCPVDEEVVPRDQLVKGFEYAKDQYVIFTEEELEAIEAEATKVMQIAEFVPLASVDPLFYESGYYLGPDKGAERPYKLLAVALEQSGFAAVAKWAARGKENLVLMRPVDGRLVMQQMRYADEVKQPVEVGDADVKPAELQLAKQFIEQLSSEKFDPSKYEDEYKTKVREMIDAKVKGEPIVSAPPQAAPAQVLDLMAALKASLAKAGEAPAKAAAAEHEEKTPARKGPKRAPRHAAAEAPKKKRAAKK